jgi:nucleoside-diphosphate-sugar epimerase
MRILILGVGYVGQALLGGWHDANDTFWTTTTSPEKVQNLETLCEQVFHLESNDPQQLESILNNCDALIVCVAPHKGNNYEQTYISTASAIKQALVKRTRPFYLLYTSSTSVYGDHDGEWVDENSTRNTSSDNGRVLMKTEDIFLSCQNEHVSVCILRLAGIYGPGRELETRARRLSGQMMPGSGDSPTNHIHLHDIVKGIGFCFEKRCIGVFDLVGNDHPTREILYCRLCEQLEILPPVWENGTPSGHGSNAKVSNRKIKEEGFGEFEPLYQSYFKI